MLKPGTPITSINKATTGAVTTSKNSTKINGGGYANCVAYLNVTAASGTSPTLDVKFQDSADGTTWYDVPSGAFTQKTATGSQRLALSNVGPYLRAVQAVGG